MKRQRFATAFMEKMVCDETVKSFCKYNSSSYCTTRKYLEHNLKHDKRGISVAPCCGACSREEYPACSNLQAVIGRSRDRMLYQIKLVDMHKYSLSKKAGYDVGFEFAWKDWIENYAEEFAIQFDRNGVRDLQVLLEKCTHPDTVSHFAEMLKRIESMPKQVSRCLEEAVA